MMARLSVPSKTFLLGEYAVLCGAPGLILTTQPSFALTVLTQAQTPPPFSQPIQDYLNDHPIPFQITFDDPHKGQGGLGFSSAQLALLMSYQDLQLQKSFTPPKGHKLAQWLADYQRLCWPGTGPKPSGADFVAQLYGGITHFQPHNIDACHTLAWLTQDIGFCIIRTHHHVSTYRHLEQCHLPDVSLLTPWIDQGYRSLADHQPDGLIEAITHYHQQLSTHQLIAPHTQHLINQLASLPGYLCAKGCGALGADTILVITDLHHHQAFKEQLQYREYTYIADHTTIHPSPGIVTDTTCPVGTEYANG